MCTVVYELVGAPVLDLNRHVGTGNLIRVLEKQPMLLPAHLFPSLLGAGTLDPIGMPPFPALT